MHSPSMCSTHRLLSSHVPSDTMPIHLSPAWRHTEVFIPTTAYLVELRVCHAWVHATAQHEQGRAQRCFGSCQAATAWCRDTLFWRHIDHSPPTWYRNMPQTLPSSLGRASARFRRFTLTWAALLGKYRSTQDMRTMRRSMCHSAVPLHLNLCLTLTYS
jgi:hypothetical protein